MTLMPRCTCPRDILPKADNSHVDIKCPRHGYEMAKAQVLEEKRKAMTARLSRNHDGDILLLQDGVKTQIVAKVGEPLWMALTALLVSPVEDREAAIREGMERAAVICDELSRKLQIEGRPSGVSVAAAATDIRRAATEGTGTKP